MGTDYASPAYDDLFGILYLDLHFQTKKIGSRQEFND